MERETTARLAADALQATTKPEAMRAIARLTTANAGREKDLLDTILELVLNGSTLDEQVSSLRTISEAQFLNLLLRALQVHGVGINTDPFERHIVLSHVLAMQHLIWMVGSAPSELDKANRRIAALQREIEAVRSERRQAVTECVSALLQFDGAAVREAIHAVQDEFEG